MSSPEYHTCPEGRDPAQLLAYVDGELDASALQELKDHLSRCPFCAAELAHLRQVDSLLKMHPDAFHPDEEALFRFASRGEDPEGAIAGHLAICKYCAEDLNILQEMIEIGSKVPDQRPVLPQAVAVELRRIFPRTGRWTAWPAIRTWFADSLKAPFRMPVLAVGTAAAVAIIAAVGLPMWRTIKKDVRSAEVLRMTEPPSPRQERSFVPADAEQAPASPPAEEPARLQEKAKRENGSVGIASDKTRPASVVSTPPPTGGESETTPARRSRTDVLEPKLPAKVELKSGKEPERLLPQSTAEGRAAPRRLEYQAAGPGGPRKSDTRSGALPGSLSDELHRRKPVSVHIVDSQGKSIPDLTWTVPRDLEARYRFVRKVSSDKKDASVSSRIAEVNEEASGSPGGGEGELAINVQVERKGEVYAIEAALVDSASNRRVKTVKEDNVPIEVAPDKIGAMVSSLLRTP